MKCMFIIVSSNKDVQKSLIKSLANYSEKDLKDTTMVINEITSGDLDKETVNCARKIVETT